MLTLPRTKCVVCQRVKQLEQYSNKQVDMLRNKISKRGQADAIPPEGLIRCTECSGVQHAEMKCSKCLIVRPLGEFAFAQRRKNEDAVSWRRHRSAGKPQLSEADGARSVKSAWSTCSSTTRIRAGSAPPMMVINRGEDQ